MNSPKPLVSIIIPVYNGSNFLREAIDSALAQTCKNIEVLVINDGSNDQSKTEIIAKSYGNRIRYYYKQNGGVASALNFGIEKMRGAWFSWLSHDDVFNPTKISDQISYIDSHPDIKIIYTDYDLINDLGEYIGSISVKPKSHLNMQIQLLESYPVNGCTTLIAKECLDDVGNFDPNLLSTQDYDMWFRLAEKYYFQYLPLKTIKSRLHSEQGSNSNSYKGEADRLYQKYINKIGYSQIVSELKGRTGSWMSFLSLRFKNYGYGGASKAILKKKKELRLENYVLDWFIRKYILLPDAFTKKIYTLINKMMISIFKIKQIIISISTRLKYGSHS